MNLKRIRLTHWWRELLVLVVCLLTGSSVLQAEIQFKDATMKITHHPSISEPYIVVDVLYFDAHGTDSYFTKDPYEGDQEGPAVYVDGYYICSPGGELCWNTHQQTAEDETKKEGWWVVNSQDNQWDGEHTYTKERSENTYTIKFWNPYKDSENAGHYRVSMYVFLKYWEVGKTHTIRIGGEWAVKGSAGTNQSKSVTTNAFTALSAIWPKPTAKMTNYNTVTLSGSLPSSYGPTTVGIYTKKATAPSGYTTDFNTSAKKQYDKGKTSFSQSESPTATPYGFDYSKGCNIPVQYSCTVSYTKSYSTTNTFTMNDMIVYGWHSVYVPGFSYPKKLSYEVTDQWSKKIKVKWEAQENYTDAEGTSYPRSKEGSWIIKNTNTGASVRVNDYSTKYEEIELDGYSVGDENNVNNIRVLFAPKDMPDPSEQNLSLWSALKAKIVPSWSFTNLEAAVSDGDNAGIDLSWSHNAIEDASGTKPYSLILQRSTNYSTSTQDGTWTDIDGFDKTIKDKTTVEGQYNDHSNQNANTTYYYRIKANVMDMVVYSPIASARLGGSKIKSFSATRGNYSSMVKLQWTVKQAGTNATNFIIQRRPLGSREERDWADIYATSGTVTSYSYDDETALPGSFNEYKIIIWSEEKDNTTGVVTQLVDDSRITDGFSVSSGIISGNITYGTGTAVEGAKVMIKQQSADGTMVSGMHSLKLGGYGSGISYGAKSDALKSLFENDFSVQMYIKPNNQVMSENGDDYQLLYVEDVLDIKLKYNASDNTYNLAGSIAGAQITSSLAVLANEWNQLSIVYGSSSKQLTAYIAQSDATESEEVATTTSSSIWGNASAENLIIGNTQTFLSNNWYDGYIDEFRFWTKALTELEILRNYNHPLAGNEDGLAIYYPLDEGIKEQRVAYDFSKKNGVSNGRHGTTKVPASSSATVLPSENQLSLMSYTDVNGYYEIRGVPFSGEGTSYSVIPTLGIHEFSPAKQSRYISMSTLNHSAVDFKDVSSFPVSGTVFYAGTDYPLEGATFYVDGVICSKDGEMIQSNDQGEFTISVPIGDHFITVKKNGHVFTNSGRYPADPNDVGTKHTFDREIKNLEFIDETLVNFTGRVVGGDIEGEKAVGFGFSKNNIGVTELVLTPLNTVPRMNVVKEVTETTYSYETNANTVPIASATNRIASNAWRGAGADDCRKLFIRTDSITGEFSAMLPPLEYSIVSMKIVKSQESVGDPVTIDLSNPLAEYNDTLHNDDGTDILYAYNTVLKHAYHNIPTFIVTQQGHEDAITEINDGAFGIRNYRFKDDNGEVIINDIYSIVNGKPVYKYGGTEGAALFVMNDRYSFDIEAYEEYENRDAATVVKDHVPLSGVIVTINNELSNEQAVCSEGGTTDEGIVVKEGQIVDLKSNQLQLNEEGKATYSWIAGLPNITSPYSRTISMTYDIGDRTYPWSGNGMEGVILGSLPTGNNFVTSGPDVIDMILRDPPGSGSSAEWTSGTITSMTQAKMAAQSFEGLINTTTKIGQKTSAGSGGLGFMKIEEVESTADMELGLIAKEEFEGGDTFSRTIETTKTISTSDESDFVGAQGDVFIGQATNVIVGEARNIGFERINANSDELQLNLKNVVTTGLSFGTTFNYTQNYIENELIPGLIKLRNSYLRTLTQAKYDAFVNDENDPVYITLLEQDDPRFGSDNNDSIVWGDLATATFSPEGPSYKMVVPINKDENYTDQVMWCNSQITNWINYLAINEQEKVEAFEYRNDKSKVKEYQNISFDAGTRVTNSYNKESAEGYKIMVHGEAGIHFNLKTGFTLNKCGVVVDIGTNVSAGYKHERDSSDTKVVSFNYTLAESGIDDALSVDVYKYGKYGPIFRTRGGQTSAPYEGKVVTKYYQPGTTIMDATMQIEVPQIDVDVPIMSDVPTGSAANYTLRLGNASEVNKDVTYKLFVLDGTNPDGAQISVDGQVLTEGRLINVPGGQTVSKSLQLRQTKQDVLDYFGNNRPDNELYEKGIGIVFASESQPEDIADTVFITARFTPSSSPVSLALSNSIMNTQTGTDLTLTFKDFDRNYNNLKAFRLQFKRQGATDWTQIKEYVLDSANKTENNEMLPSTGATVSYKLPMSSYSDGEYTFRVVSASTYGTGEVYRYSEELTMSKDMQRPTPLGQPEPSNGILNIGDDLSVTFNEIILKGELTKTANFKVTGVLNGAPVAHWTAMSMQNTAVATASTEANINLAGKDFSFDTWVNLSAGAGTLLSHGSGTARFAAGITADNKLTVNIAGQTYTSANSVPVGKWSFLTLSYKNTANGGILNANVAYDAYEIRLFDDVVVVKYNGNGPLEVGKNLTGSIHELLLWDEAHDMTTALLNRSITKNPSTRHLIGYWKMDEGEGTSIRDYSRNRHMTMTNATWYLNNANKSIVLDGQHYLSIDASQLPVCVDDDYAVEFWMRGAKQSVDQQLMQMGEIGLMVTADGKLQFIGKSVYNDAPQTMATNAANLTDNAWHHIAVNVLRQGATAVYVDGVRRLTTSSDNVGSINTNNLILGAHRTLESGAYSYNRCFIGQIDEVRIWNATMNGEMLIKNRKVRLTGSEDGLVAYYPFEKQTLDEGNQVVSVGNAADLSSSLSAQVLDLFADSASIIYSDEAPAMRQKPTETNVSFTFVASNEKVVINIDEDPATIEGCTLNFTVRDVRDENGNYSVPAVWSAFVNRKELAWDEDELGVKQQVKDESSVTATIVNKSGTQQMWTLSGLPSWLTASSEYGTTNPLAQSKVTFTVSPATPIGKYQETVYLKSNNGIKTPLTLNVTVTGQVPTWNVNVNDFENSMNVIGRVMVQGIPMDDPDDIVAAFVGEECRGLAHPVYSSRYDNYYVTIDIFGDETDEDTLVTFRAYDASTGTLYPEVLPDFEISFESLTLEGSYADPVVLTALDKIEQSTELKKGWNWLSLYVKTDDMSPKSLLSKIADDVEIIKSQQGWLMNEDGNWDGNLTGKLTNDQMYTVKLKNDRTLRLVGQPVVPAESPINLRGGWNWVGYYGRQVASVADALADMSPEDGDILKGQTGVAYYDQYEWAGSLVLMEPGVGYMIFAGINPGEIKPFSYPGSTVSHAPMRAPMRRDADSDANDSYTFQPVDFRNYSGNAIMSAKIVKDNVPVTNAEIAIFADDECRAVAVTNDKGVAYLTIPGDAAATLSFKVAWGGDIYQTVETVTYETDAVYGTPKNPMVIKLGTPTGIDGVDANGETGTVYDLQGRKVETQSGSSELENGIFIIDGQKRAVIK